MNSDSRHLPKRKNVRLKGYDYSSGGYYFVTICTHNKRPIIDKVNKSVEGTLRELPERFSGLSTDYYVIMPSHLHIIFVLRESKVPLWEVIRTFKALVSKRTGVKDFWQRGYYEHVIRNEKALSRIRAYIQNNPLAEKLKFEQFYEDGLDKSSPYKPGHCSGRIYPTRN